MQDGYTQSGAGDSDMRVAGKDLQHARQARTADEAPVPVRIVRQQAGDGGPMKAALDEELARHRESKEMRLAHLLEHYQR
jgi:hypothetical protein